MPSMPTEMRTRSFGSPRAALTCRRRHTAHAPNPTRTALEMRLATRNCREDNARLDEVIRNKPTDG